MAHVTPLQNVLLRALGDKWAQTKTSKQKPHNFFLKSGDIYEILNCQISKRKPLIDID
jgi:hypothetical protein